MELKIEFPFIVVSKDYNNFDEIRDLLTLLTGKMIKFKQLPQNPYQAMFYVGKCPKLDGGYIKKVIWC